MVAAQQRNAAARVAAAEEQLTYGLKQAVKALAGVVPVAPDFFRLELEVLAKTPAGRRPRKIQAVVVKTQPTSESVPAPRLALGLEELVAAGFARQAAQAAKRKGATPDEVKAVRKAAKKVAKAALKAQKAAKKVAA